MVLASQAVDGAGQKSRIAQDDLVFTEGCRVTLIGGLHIRVHQRPDMGNPLQKINRQFLGRHAELEIRLCRIFLLETEGDRDLFLQVIDDILDHHCDPAVIIVASEFPGPVIAGKQNVEQLVDDVYDRRAVRLVKDIHVIYIPAVLIILQNPVRDALNAVADIFSHIYHPCSDNGFMCHERRFAAFNQYTIFLLKRLASAFL